MFCLLLENLRSVAKIVVDKCPEVDPTRQRQGFASRGDPGDDSPVAARVDVVELGLNRGRVRVAGSLQNALCLGIDSVKLLADRRDHFVDRRQFGHAYFVLRGDVGIGCGCLLGMGNAVVIDSLALTGVMAEEEVIDRVVVRGRPDYWWSGRRSGVGIYC